MKTVSAEENYGRFVWYILNKIKERLLFQSNRDEHIIYTVFLYPQTKDWDKPNSVLEQQLLDKLKEQRVIEETQEKTYFEIGKESDTDNPESAGIYYYFKVKIDSFNKKYNHYQKLVEQYNKAEKQGNTLVFHESGEIIYIDPLGNEYQANLKTKTNSYSLLKFLVHNPHKTFEFKELADSLKEVRSDVEAPDDERRVRDTIQSIKEKLEYQGDDLFKSDYGFGLKCNVLIKK